jgi:hypothetical protein
VAEVSQMSERGRVRRGGARAGVEWESEGVVWEVKGQGRPARHIVCGACVCYVTTMGEAYVICMCVYVCVCMCMYVCVCECMCVYVYVCVCCVWCLCVLCNVHGGSVCYVYACMHLAQKGVWEVTGRSARHDHGWMCRVCVCVCVHMCAIRRMSKLR